MISGAPGDVTWATVVVALAAGAIGSFLTALLAFGGRIIRTGREVAANDRAIGNIDRHLETWVSDETLRLVRELELVRNELAKRGLSRSGEYGVQLALAKERALHAYRDQETTARSQAAEIRAREGAFHALVRAWRLSGSLELRAPERVLPILEQWAAPPTRHLTAEDEPQPLESDPRDRTIESTLAYLNKRSNAMT